MNSDFKFLQTAQLIFKVLAWVAVVFFAGIALLTFIGRGGADAPWFAGFVFLLGGALYFLLIYTVSEIIRMLNHLNDKIEKIDSMLSGKSS